MGNVDLTVDMRVFTEDGRAQIAEDFLKTKMIADSFKTVITNDTLDVTDVFKEIKKRNDTYEAVKAKVMQDSTLAQMLNSPAYTQAQKDIIINGITNEVLKELGYKPIEVKFIATTEPGRDGEQVKGFYSTQTNTMYINTLYSDTNYKLLSTSGTEAQRAMDAQEGSTFDQDDAYRAERSKYSEEFGSYLAGYTNFALSNTGQGSLSTESNPSNLYSKAIKDNNAEFATLDKSKGDNSSFWNLSDIQRAKDLESSKINVTIKALIEVGLDQEGVKKSLANNAGFKALMKDGDGSFEAIFAEEKEKVLNTNAKVDAIVTALNVASIGLIFIDGVSIKVTEMTAKKLVKEAIEQGLKISPEKIVSIAKVDGKIVWLEKGSSRAGLGHILRPDRVQDFLNIGVKKADISKLVMDAVSKGKIIDTVGSGKNIRNVYEVIFKGKVQKVAVGVSDNGFIVTAHPY
ncbi:hypothetical protein [Arcobacter sp.]|uniref:hypothetical protein n=1 Tax=Arcobacter sp. TaxID=1872629 RepID=UPI003C728CFA